MFFVDDKLLFVDAGCITLANFYASALFVYDNLLSIDASFYRMTE